MMMQFTRFDDNGDPVEQVHVSPSAVASVRETHDREAFGANQPIAVIRFVDGTECKVYDYNRDVARRIQEAQ